LLADKACAGETWEVKHEMLVGCARRGCGIVANMTDSACEGSGSVCGAEEAGFYDEPILELKHWGCCGRCAVGEEEEDERVRS